MPAARKSKSSSSRTSRFKEPAALKRLNKSLDAAQQALTDLRKESGRGAQDMYKDLRSFVSNARRDTGKLGKALAKDFDQAQKRVKASTTSSSRSTGSRAKSATTRAKSATTRAKPATTRAKSATTRAKSTTSGTKRASSSRSGSSRSRSSS